MKVFGYKQVLISTMCVCIPGFTLTIFDDIGIFNVFNKEPFNLFFMSLQIDFYVSENRDYD